MGWAQLSGLAGGLGLFLLGMTFMTEGLRNAAGPSMRDILVRSTRGPFTALLTGMTFTLIVQSSSATTLAAIGFVNAGLLSFVNVLGVLYGANLGTTLTGWLVSVLGFQVKIAAFALPSVFLGAALHLFGRDRLKGAGLALAGFGLLFLGIDYMQAGMDDAGRWTVLQEFSASQLADRAVLVALGVVMTIVMQSSSAALAVTLTFLATGGIALPEAAALVIGQNIGTTFTAVLGSIGGTGAAKRTAAAHVLFNVVTGVVALAFFSPLLYLIDMIGFGSGRTGDPFQLAAFHTLFNLIGVILMLPTVTIQNRMLAKVFPEREEGVGRPRYLDRAALSQPSAALQSVDREFNHFREIIADMVESGLLNHRSRVTAMESAWHHYARLKNLAGATTEYIGHVTSAPSFAEVVFNQLRVIEHYRRAASHLAGAVEHARGKNFDYPPMRKWMEEYDRAIREAQHVLKTEQPLDEAVERLGGLASAAEARRGWARKDAFDAVSREGADVRAAMESVDYVNALTAFLYQLSRAYTYWARPSEHIEDVEELPS